AALHRRGDRAGAVVGGEYVASLAVDATGRAGDVDGLAAGAVADRRRRRQDGHVAGGVGFAGRADQAPGGTRRGERQRFVLVARFAVRRDEHERQLGGAVVVQGERRERYRVLRATLVGL